jgi:hypothetical protein
MRQVGVPEEPDTLYNILEKRCPAVTIENSIKRIWFFFFLY